MTRRRPGRTWAHLRAIAMLALWPGAITITLTRYNS